MSAPMVGGRQTAVRRPQKAVCNVKQKQSTRDAMVARGNHNPTKRGSAEGGTRERHNRGGDTCHF